MASLFAHGRMEFVEGHQRHQEMMGQKVAKISWQPLSKFTMFRSSSTCEIIKFANCPGTTAVQIEIIIVCPATFRVHTFSLAEREKSRRKGTQFQWSAKISCETLFCVRRCSLVGSAYIICKHQIHVEFHIMCREMFTRIICRNFTA